MKKKTFYGISLERLNATNLQEGNASTTDKLLFSYLMKQLIQEFLSVEANMLPINQEVKSTNENASMLEGRCVFSFDKEEYLSDITKTTDLVVDDLAKKLVEQNIASLKPSERESAITYFNNYFQALCVEKSFDASVSKKDVVKGVFEALDELESEHLNTSVDSQKTIARFLATNGIRQTVDALAF